MITIHSCRNRITVPDDQILICKHRPRPSAHLHPQMWAKTRARFE